MTLPSLFRLSRTALLALLVAAASVASAQPGAAWEKLTPSQKQALAPLQRDWSSIDTVRQQKWLEVAARFPSIPAEERLRLQDRMTAWARLTPNERASARLQFQETRNLPADEKQARWQAYQALSEDERKSLAQRARPPAKTASAAESGVRRSTANDSGAAKSNVVVPRAAATRAVAPALVNARPGATTTTVTTRAAPPAHHQAGMPKIAATPGFVDTATLLPQRGPQGAAVRSAASASASTPAPTRQP